MIGQVVDEIHQFEIININLKPAVDNDADIDGTNQVMTIDQFSIKSDLFVFMRLGAIPTHTTI